MATKHLDNQTIAELLGNVIEHRLDSGYQTASPVAVSREMKVSKVNPELVEINRPGDVVLEVRGPGFSTALITIYVAKDEPDQAMDWSKNIAS